jgi:hypothetical protein
MRIATASLTSVSPYSQSRPHETPKLDSELPDDFEKRTWREKAHYNGDGHLFIPPAAFCSAMADAASRMGRKIPGRGNATYAKFFASGLMSIEPIMLPETHDNVKSGRYFLDANGKRGSGTRVWRIFPEIPEWKADVEFQVLADEITPDLFEETLVYSGKFIGIGRFRPINRGYFGRFDVKRVKWQEV